MKTPMKPDTMDQHALDLLEKKDWPALAALVEQGRWDPNHPIIMDDGRKIRYSLLACLIYGGATEAALAVIQKGAAPADLQSRLPDGSVPDRLRLRSQWPMQEERLLPADRQRRHALHHRRPSEHARAVQHRWAGNPAGRIVRAPAARPPPHRGTIA